MERSAYIAFSAVSFSNNNEFQFATNSVVCLLFIWQLLYFAVVNSLGSFFLVVVVPRTTYDVYNDLIIIMAVAIRIKITSAMHLWEMLCANCELRMIK